MTQFQHHTSLLYLFQQFAKESVESFHCDFCEHAKQHHVKFSLSSIKSIEPLAVIHSDVSGLATIPNVFGTKWFASFFNF